MKMTKINTRRTLTLAALIAVPMALVGCSTSANAPRHAGDIDAVRNDPSPAMHTLGQRKTDRYNMYAHTKDTNLRAISKDIDRMFFLDRPSRLYDGIKP